MKALIAIITVLAVGCVTAEPTVEQADPLVDNAASPPQRLAEGGPLIHEAPCVTINGQSLAVALFPDKSWEELGLIHAVGHPFAQPANVIHVQALATIADGSASVDCDKGGFDRVTFLLR